MLHCQNLSNLTWNDVDVGSLLTRIDDASIRLKAEREARPDLAALNDSIRQQEEVHSKAVDKKNAEDGKGQSRSEEHTSELQSLMRISYAVICLKKKKHTNKGKVY